MRTDFSIFDLRNRSLVPAAPALIEAHRVAVGETLRDKGLTTANAKAARRRPRTTKN